MRNLKNCIALSISIFLIPLAALYAQDKLPPPSETLKNLAEKQENDSKKLVDKQTNETFQLTDKLDSDRKAIVEDQKKKLNNLDASSRLDKKSPAVNDASTQFAEKQRKAEEKRLFTEQGNEKLKAFEQKAKLAKDNLQMKQSTEVSTLKGNQKAKLAKETKAKIERDKINAGRKIYNENNTSGDKIGLKVRKKKEKEPIKKVDKANKVKPATKKKVKVRKRKTKN